MIEQIEPSSTSNTAIAARRSPRLLLIAYSFPPVGGAGVQRPVKWVKYLRRLGWDVTVLTPENPSVPVRDESLLADIPDDVLVVRARTWEPDYQAKQRLIDGSRSGQRGIASRVVSAVNGLAKQAIKLVLQPDPQILWVPNALHAGRRILTELSHDVILVTAPAYSSFFIGTSLKRQFGLPLVLDFRDEWDMSGKYLENAQRDLFSRTIQDRMQRYILKRADAVVATTIASTANLADKLSRLKKTTTPTITVYNGFDAEEFAAASPSNHEHRSLHGEAKAVDQSQRLVDETSLPSNSQRTPILSDPCAPADLKNFRLLYTGTLWNLTTIEPLVAAIQRLNETNPDLVSRLELVCVGRKTAEQLAILQRLNGTGCRLELIDYCDHVKVLDWLRSTDAVCLLLSDVPGAERVVPAKLFEYMANRKDMLAIAPRGETANIVRRFFPQGHFEPKDIDAIVGWLKNRLAGDADVLPQLPDIADIHEYSRTAQTERLVGLLNKLVEDRLRTRSTSP